MPNYLPASPERFALSLTFTFANDFGQSAAQRFYLRNLHGETEQTQIESAIKLANDVGKELNYLTGLALTQCIVHSGNKKMQTIWLPDLISAAPNWLFTRGIDILFPRPIGYFWTNGRGSLANRILADKLDDSWQRTIAPWPKQTSLRLPCILGNPPDNTFFFAKTGPSGKRSRKRTKQWGLKYDKADPIFRSFINRLQEKGNLAIGGNKLWMGTNIAPVISGIRWQMPPTKSPNVLSNPAHQPVDGTDYVYLIKMGRSAYYKIGKSNDPAKRLASMQTGAPQKLKLLHYFPADNASKAEETLHLTLKEQRQSGEWFRLRREQVQLLCGVKEFKNGRFRLEDKSVPVDELFGLS